MCFANTLDLPYVYREQDGFAYIKSFVYLLLTIYDTIYTIYFIRHFHKKQGKKLIPILFFQFYMQIIYRFLTIYSFMTNKSSRFPFTNIYKCKKVQLIHGQSFQFK